MTLLLQYTLIFASVLILVALGGCFSEHSGVINIGLEGIMVMGALGGALMMKYLPNSMAAPLVILLVVLASVFVGMLFSLLLGVASIHFNADQTLVGTALNLLGPALAVVIVRAINTAENVDNVSSTIAYKHAKKAFLVNIGKFEFSWFMLLALLVLIASYIVLYKTKFGAHLRAVGEHPEACESLGIDVYKVRYICVILSGFFAGLGGAFVTLATINQFRPSVIVGQGFIAIAAVIFGKFSPGGATKACLLFGLCSGIKSLAAQSNVVSPNLISMIPYVVTIIALVLFVGKAHTPAANGKIFVKSK